MKTTQIASRINEHLKRLEKDAEFNKKDKRGFSVLYNSQAYAGGRYVQVQYKSYWSPSSLPKDHAAEYLAWLDAGNKGTHYEFERQKKFGSK